MTTIGQIACSVCGKRAFDGYAIYRTSPYGEDFVGVCADHRTFPAPDPDLAGMIEEENMKGKP